MLLNNLFEALTRTGQGKTAVVGWGRGMGHKGHMMLASSVITKAKEVGGDPYFVVSRTVGKDDPLTADEKLAIYKKVFPQQGHVFQAASDDIPNLTFVLTDLNKQGYDSAVVVVGADQVKAFQYLKNYNNKPDKSGNIAFKFNNLEIISRQETGDPSAGEEGPRATPMRAILNDPAATPQQQFQVWRDAMSPEVSDEEVRDLMAKAKERMGQFAAPKKKTKEVAEANPNQQISRYNPNGGTYRGAANKMPTLDPQDPVHNADRFGPEHDEPYDHNDDYDRADLKRAMAKQMDTLTDREQEVIKARFWDNMTYNEIGAEVGLSGVRIRQIEAKALRKLKHPSRVDTFRAFVNVDEAELDEACWKDYKQIGMKKKGGKQVPNCVPKESMLPRSAFAGTPKNKLGPAAHLKGSMKRPARAGDLVGDVEEGLGSKLAGLGLAGAMAFGAGGANARVSGDQDPSINRLTGKPNVTQVAPSDVKPATAAPAGFNKEYLQSVIDGKHPRPLISKEKAADILMKMNAVDEAKIKGADGKACWKGYKYAGTKNGKDKCVPIGESYETEMTLAILKLFEGKK